MTFTCIVVKIIASQRLSVFGLWFSRLENQGICRPYMVVNYLTGENTTLALRQIEDGKLLFTIHIGLSVIDIED
jgi:hypothetical protein